MSVSPGGLLERARDLDAEELAGVAGGAWAATLLAAGLTHPAGGMLAVRTAAVCLVAAAAWRLRGVARAALERLAATARRADRLGSGRRLWPLAVGLHGVDVLATVAGVGVLGVTSEAAPVAAAAFDLASSPLEMLAVGVALKLAALGLAAVAWLRWPRVAGFGPDPWRAVVPLLATARGAWLVAVGLEAVRVGLLLD